MRVIWVALVALILLNSSHGQMQDLSDTAMTSELDLIEIIGGNVQNFQSSSEISFDVGYIDSEIIEIKWFLKDGDILRYDGESEYQSDTNDWDSIPIHHHVISPCRCVLIIDVIVDEIRIHREYGIVSAEDESSSISSDNWVIIPKNPVYSIEKQIVDITYLQAGAYSDFNVRWGILPNLPNESDCIDGSHTDPSVNSWTVVENSFNSNEFSIIQDLSSYSDGWWTIIRITRYR